MEERIKQFAEKYHIREKEVMEYVMEDPMSDFTLYKYFCELLGVGK